MGKVSRKKCEIKEEWYLENESTDLVLYNHTIHIFKFFFLMLFRKSCKMVGVRVVENNTVLIKTQEVARHLKKISKGIL